MPHYIPLRPAAVSAKLETTLNRERTWDEAINEDEVKPAASDVGQEAQHEYDKQ